MTTTREMIAAERAEDAMPEIDDPNRCPRCGGCDEYQFQENASRPTWQPVKLGQGAEVDDYLSFDYGDDVNVDSYECRSCGSEWPTLDDLADDQETYERIGHGLAYDFDAAAEPDDLTDEDDIAGAIYRWTDRMDVPARLAWIYGPTSGARATMRGRRATVARWEREDARRARVHARFNAQWKRQRAEDARAEQALDVVPA
jgi:hypothetical protein